jgi:hypothetical protein
VRYELVLCIIYMTVNLQSVNYLILIVGLSACVRQTTVAKLMLACLGSFFLDAEDIKCISLGAIWNLSEATGLP